MALSSRLKIDLSFGIALLILAFIAFVSYRSVVELRRDQQQVLHAEQVLRELEETFSHLTDAETGQRGFLLTRQDRFLEPYTAAVSMLAGDLRRLDSLVVEPVQVARLRRIEALARRRMELTEQTVRLGQAGRFDEAVAIVAGGEGKGVMDEIRGVVVEMEAYEFDQLA
jgi:CHASE3 domain sensor protein